MATARVGRHGRITLPSAIRRAARLEEGDHVTVTVQGGAVVLKPAMRTLLDLRGSVKVTAPQDFEAIRRSVLRRHADEVAESGT